MRSIARILVTNSGRINQKRIINTFGSYLLTRNASSTQQQQIEKTVEELAKENGNLQQKVEQLTKENEQQKQDFEVI
jgi:predicted RNase H-like nuclease (RuvC/YqgF family)